MWGSSGHWVHSISGPGDNHALNVITQGFTDFFSVKGHLGNI